MPKPLIADLPEEYRERARPYIEPGKNEQSRISNAFLWSNTLEGNDFWRRCEDVLYEPDPFRPNLPDIPPVTIQAFHKAYLADAKIVDSGASTLGITWDGLVYIHQPNTNICPPSTFFTFFMTPVTTQCGLKADQYFPELAEWVTIIKKL